jgi:hypothetical protein
MVTERMKEMDMGPGRSPEPYCSSADAGARHEEEHRPDRATRRSREPPSDAEIERGLRERAVSDPRAAEILLRWLQRPRAEERVGGVDLESMSERELERLYAGLVRIAALPPKDLQALVTSLLAAEHDA